MFRKYLVGFVSVLMILSLVLSACTTTKKTDPPKGTDTPTTPAVKGPAVGGEIVFDVTDDPDTFALYWLTSAYAADITDRVYGDGLVRTGYDYKPEAYLAEKWDISADGKVYTFHLRKGAKFHDGKEVTAKDWEFSYNTVMSKDYAGPEASTVKEIASVKAVNDTTFEITLKEAFAPFLYGGAQLQVIPMHIFKDVPVKDMASSDAWKKPIGSGPWKFVEWKTGQYSLLERNADHWAWNTPGAANGTNGPFIEKIRIRVISEDQTAMAALEAGELSLKDSVDPAQVDRLKNDFKDKLVAYDWDRMGYGYQTFNFELYPTNIKEVRQALSYALDRPTILKGIMDNKASIPAGFVPPIHWVFDKDAKGYAYDPAKAEDLIKKAGFTKNAKGIYEKDGKPLKLKYVGTKGSPIVEGIALQSQKDWAKIGVDTELVLVDFNTLLDKHLKPGDYSVTFSGLGFSTDPHYSFYQQFHTDNILVDAKGMNNGTNRARYRNEQVNKLIEKGKLTTDINERIKIYQEAQRIIIDDAPANWIYVNVWTDFAKKEFQGIVNWNGYGINTRYMSQWHISAK